MVVGLPCPPCPQRGGLLGWLPADLVVPATAGGAYLLCCPPTLPFALFLPPSPRPPFPSGAGGDFFLYFAGGSAPGTPALARLRHLQSLPSRYPAAEIRDSPQNRKNRLFYWQCRQPRRGGTGGEELRRLRWSSPPGLGEQVPPGFSPPAGHHSGRSNQCRRGSAPPPDTTAAGRTSAAGVQPSRRTPQRQVEPVPRGFSRRDAGGGPPPQKKQRLQAKKSAKKP